MSANAYNEFIIMMRWLFSSQTLFNDMGHHDTVRVQALTPYIYQNEKLNNILSQDYYGFIYGIFSIFTYLPRKSLKFSSSHQVKRIEINSNRTIFILFVQFCCEKRNSEPLLTTKENAQKSTYFRVVYYYQPHSYYCNESQRKKKDLRKSRIYNANLMAHLAFDSFDLSSALR